MKVRSYELAVRAPAHHRDRWQPNEPHDLPTTTSSSRRYSSKKSAGKQQTHSLMPILSVMDPYSDRSVTELAGGALRETELLDRAVHGDRDTY